MNNLFKAQMVGITAVESALGLAYEAGVYRKASEHEESKDILYPKEEEEYYGEGQRTVRK